MTGQLIYVVGPSGSGKDSILQELALDLPPDCHIMQRFITRLTPTETEVAHSLSRQDFEYKEQRGDFALSWRANGLAYGIDKGLDQYLQQGKKVLVNGSRAHWPQVYQRYAKATLVIIEVRPELLQHRLEQRGRETAGQIKARLKRHEKINTLLVTYLEKNPTQCWNIDNSDSLQVAVQQLKQSLLKN